MSTVDAAQAAERFHALSDPTRVAIVGQLISGEKCVCELMEAVDSAQSRLSFHLKVLKDSGIVTDRRDGRWVYYTLEQEMVAAMAEFLTELCPRVRRGAAAGARAKVLPLRRAGTCCA